MAGRGERGPAALSPLRTVALALGFICAISASVTIFVTENADYLRIGILVALWGFVLAALAAGRRQTEQVMAAGSEVELRKSYELELEREVAARREYELRLEAQLRRELQDEFASQVGALHEEMVRLRRELSEQWDSELRVERMVMRTQSVRMAGDQHESLEPSPTTRASIDAVPSDSASSGTSSYESGSDNGGSDNGGSYGAGSYVGSTYYGGSDYGGSYDGGCDYGGSYDGGSYDAGSVGVQAVDPEPWKPPEPADDLRIEQAASHGRPFETASTSEVPVVNGLVPPVPAAPPPPQPPPVVYPPIAPTPTASSRPDNSFAQAPDDVLSRVLAEAGANAGGRRRKHRYADED